MHEGHALIGDEWCEQQVAWKIPPRLKAIDGVNVHELVVFSTECLLEALTQQVHLRAGCSYKAGSLAVHATRLCDTHATQEGGACWLAESIHQVDGWTAEKP